MSSKSTKNNFIKIFKGFEVFGKHLEDFQKFSAMLGNFPKLFTIFECFLKILQMF